MPATVDDLYGISEVQSETWMATYPNTEYGITEEDILSEDFFSEDRIEGRRKTITDTNSKIKFWVAKKDEKVVGYCSVEKNADSNKIRSLYIIPAFQGRGIGQRLMETAFGFLDLTKPTKLTVAVYNHRAISFYEKLGFKKGGELSVNPEGSFPSGHEIPEMEMIKDPTSNIKV